jgi:hypothetical protein
MALTTFALPGTPVRLIGLDLSKVDAVQEPPQVSPLGGGPEVWGVVIAGREYQVLDAADGALAGMVPAPAQAEGTAATTTTTTASGRHGGRHRSADE